MGKNVFHGLVIERVWVFVTVSHQELDAASFHFSATSSSIWDMIGSLFHMNIHWPGNTKLFSQLWICSLSQIRLIKLSLHKSIRVSQNSYGWLALSLRQRKLCVKSSVPVLLVLCFFVFFSYHAHILLRAVRACGPWQNCSGVCRVMVAWIVFASSFFFF